MTVSDVTEVTDHRWWTFAVATTAQVMIALDLTIMLIALPSAQADLGMSSSQGRWVLTAYALALGALLMLGGRIADLIGRRTAVAVGALAFAAASAVGGSAGDPGVLLGARAAQGAAAAVLAPAALSLVSVTFVDHHERSRAFGLFAAALQGGIGVGLLLGGALTQYLGWRWCIYINVPIAVVVALGARRFVPAGHEHRHGGVDLPGAVLVSAGLGCLVFAVSEAANDGWGSPLILGLLVAAVVLLAGFASWEQVAARPLLALHVIADRRRGGANLAFLATNLGANGAFLLLTYQAQSILGYSALQAGFAFLPLIVVITLSATRLTPRLLNRFAPRSLMAAGLIVLALGLLAMTRMSLHGSYPSQILIPLLLIGLGMGLSTGPSMSSGTRVEDPADATAASALIRSSQQIGAALGTAIMTTIAASYAAGAHRLPVAQATVHGFSASSYWAAAIVVLAAVGVAVIVPGNVRRSSQSGSF
jgi:EmrB/QacA subfamily drug resistance transporter